MLGPQETLKPAPRPRHVRMNPWPGAKSVATSEPLSLELWLFLVLCLTFLGDPRQHANQHLFIATPVALGLCTNASKVSLLQVFN